MQDVSVNTLQILLWNICKEALGTALFTYCAFQHFLFQILVFNGAHQHPFSHSQLNTSRLHYDWQTQKHVQKQCPNSLQCILKLTAESHQPQNSLAFTWQKHQNNLQFASDIHLQKSINLQHRAKVTSMKINDKYERCPQMGLSRFESIWKWHNGDWFRKEDHQMRLLMLRCLINLRNNGVRFLECWNRGGYVGNQPDD